MICPTDTSIFVSLLCAPSLLLSQNLEYWENGSQSRVRDGYAKHSYLTDKVLVQWVRVEGERWIRGTCTSRLTYIFPQCEKPSKRCFGCSCDFDRTSICELRFSLDFAGSAYSSEISFVGLRISQPIPYPYPLLVSLTPISFFDLPGKAVLWYVFHRYRGCSSPAY